MKANREPTWLVTWGCPSHVPNYPIAAVGPCNINEIDSFYPRAPKENTAQNWWSGVCFPTQALSLDVTDELGVGPVTQVRVLQPNLRRLISCHTGHKVPGSDCRDRPFSFHLLHLHCRSLLLSGFLAGCGDTPDLCMTDCTALTCSQTARRSPEGQNESPLICH